VPSAPSATPSEAAPRPVPGGAGRGPLGRLGRIGGFCARHAVWVIAAWLVLLICVLVGKNIAAPTYSDAISLPGSQSNTGAQLLSASEPTAGQPNGLVVFHASSGTVSAQQAAVNQTLTNLRGLPHVTDVSSPVTSTAGNTAYTTVSFDENLKALGNGYTTRLDSATAPATAAGLGVGYGGQFDQIVEPPADDRKSEAVGIAVALVILLLVFGSVLGALLPLATALVSVLVGLSVVGIVAAAITFSTAAPTLATMLGLGVGIDYALFLTTRFRQDLMDGYRPVEAAARTADSSGHAVLVAGCTVAVAMLSLYASGLTFIGDLGFAATMAVLISASAALTLVPAAFGLVGRNIDRRHLRHPVAEASDKYHSGWKNYAAFASRHAWELLVAGVVFLCVLAIPLVSMRLGHVDDSANPAGSTTRNAFEWIAQGSGPGFGPGANGTFTAVINMQGATASPTTVTNDLTRALNNTAGIASFTPFTPSPNGQLLVSTITPSTAPQSAATGGLFNTLTGQTLPNALKGTGAQGYLTGNTAAQFDFRDTVARRLPIIIAVVLVLAFLLLMTVFRSLLIPLKAVILNLLTTGASYGVLVAAFQFGWGDAILGLDEPVPIESYVPMMMFAIVFGLSMDYEIFLLSRISEHYHETGDNQYSVSAGLATTARVISSAALIMTAVFLSFISSSNVVIKMLALGLAISVVLDATIVRLVLVPSTMFLLGKRNWWLPRWLDRALPHLRA